MRHLLLPALLAAWSVHVVAADKVDFDRDIRPILSNTCFKCHGPDEKERKGSDDAGLRLDVEEDAKRKLGDGFAIVPGKPAESELVKRIQSTDEDAMMPPKTSGKMLTPAQKELLARWIAEGAKYTKHWAWTKPVKAEPPKVKDAAWPKNAIDAFILARLEKEGLRPSPEADKLTLVRRLYLDLIGVPPTPEEADKFAADSSPDSYEKLVDQLLKSPQYGERWARRWLDLARYADTNGYEKDRQRSIWPYRDWVIKAINDDLPFDQFTIKQLAGDMLPNATQDDRVATGLHRNTMLNEEGGIDPLEFRFYAMVDRTATTGAAWLGLTVGCAQCHTHKFDPLTHTEYYGLMGLLNNADEPEVELPTPESKAKRAEIEKQVAALQADLPSKFAVDDVSWSLPTTTLKTSSAAKAEPAADNSWHVTGEVADVDTYTLTLETDGIGLDRLKLDMLTEGEIGPGRTPHGNFVLTEISATASPKDKPEEATPVKITRATADFAQNMFPVEHAFDGNGKTGWAVDGQGRKDRTAVFYFEKPVGFAAGTKFTVKLEQQYGGKHTIARLRASLGKPAEVTATVAERRKAALDKAFSDWQMKAEKDAVVWKQLRPTALSSTLPVLTLEDDDSVFSSGDIGKSDTYTVALKPGLKGITAIRLEGIPDPRLPRNGPGRVYYEGAFGDFALSNITAEANGQLLKFSDATQSFASGNLTAKNALDDNLQSEWSINGAQGQEVRAIFVFETPVDADELTIKMLFERYYASALGRFRLSVTTDPQPMRSVTLPANVNAVLAKPQASRTKQENDVLFQYFLSIAPELAAARKEIESLKASIANPPTTLVMQEWNNGQRRPTYRHHRGEFLSPKEIVEPNVPKFLPPLTGTHNRLEFSKWLVSRDNPLTARVTVNRQWQAFFGRGLVRTLEDFGFQGATPSHPELLDYLAVQLMDDGWSLKRLHKLIVMSATYRQSTKVSPELLERDANNVLLARGPRFRYEAEIVRDSALKAAGLLSSKMYGLSVFPPQPAAVTTEGSYGGLNWTPSAGEDRYRRSLYTFAKRTAPFALYNTFDGPTGEACIVRREVSNTPLQGLSLLNDPVFIDAHQALGRQIAAFAGNDAAKAVRLFRVCLTRQPTDEEKARLLDFVGKLRPRLDSGELKADKIAGAGEGDLKERALWTLVARGLLNLDEAVTKN
jgi:hypothetical protein